MNRKAWRKKKQLLLLAAYAFHSFSSCTLVSGRHRTCYVRQVNLKRRHAGEFHSLVRDLREKDPALHARYFRMSRKLFDRLLLILGPRVRHSRTHLDPVSATERLAVTLRILATGTSQASTAMSYRLGFATVSKIFKKTIQALWEGLHENYMPEPTAEGFAKTAEEFGDRWNFPHCCGAIDGKHCETKCPPNSGSLYYNYMGTYSIVLMAFVDASYKFIAIDVGGYGKQSDGGTFRNWVFGEAVVDGSVNVPATTHQRCCPSRLCRRRRVSARKPLNEALQRKRLNRRTAHFQLPTFPRPQDCGNAFGILAVRWRILRVAMDYSPAQAEMIVKACAVLHNFLHSHDLSPGGHNTYFPPGMADAENEDGTVRGGAWRRTYDEDGNGEELTRERLKKLRQPAYRHQANAHRETFKTYFNSEAGRVEWQERMALGK